MLTKIMKWVSIDTLLLALLLSLLWPSFAGNQTLLGLAVCVGTIWAIQTGRTGKYFWDAGYTLRSHQVKYEN